ncbi:MAG: hypothetical protein FWE62_04235 [Firmicutes bacterium]|nr:hypothetical protein [Bacillota bacterium]
MDKTSTQKSELKIQAENARRRLKSGYWENLQSERDAAIRDAKKRGDSTETLEEYYRSVFLHRVNAYNNAVDNKEEAFYKRVCEIVENGDDLNPVSRLMDQSAYERLDAAGKQRYIVNLMQKFAQMKERYDREKRLIK